MSIVVLSLTNLSYNAFIIVSTFSIWIVFFVSKASVIGFSLSKVISVSVYWDKSMLKVISISPTPGVFGSDLIKNIIVNYFKSMWFIFI